MFLAAFAGNTFYSAALLTNLRVWGDYGPYGGNGWVGSDGSRREEWVWAGLPFFLGAAGVLVLDASVGVQFWVYGDGEARVVVVEEEEGGRSRYWRRVSGWMRGWMPGWSEGDGDEEREALVGERDVGGGYRTWAL